MAVFHVDVNKISKGSVPGGSAGFAAYLERRDAGHATRAMAYLARDGQETEDLVHSASVNLPSWARDGAHFWEMADRYERGGGVRQGVVARHYQITLPRELSAQARIELADDLRAVFFARYVHTYAIHCPPARDGSGENPHLHVMVSPRRDDHERAQGPKDWFSAKPTGAHKDRFWDEKRALQGIRAETALLINAALEREGQAVAVSADRLRGQGYGRSGAHYAQGQSADEIARIQDAQTALKQAGVQQMEQGVNVLAWQAQKEREGIRDISREAVVDHARDRFWAHDHSAVRDEERARSLIRTIERAYARTGREHSVPTSQALRQERGAALAPERDREPDLDRVWERPLIGNRNSGIYHTPEQANYGDVAPQHQARFWTERAAVEAGYRRAANDHYGPGSGQAREAGEDQAHATAWRRRRRGLGLGVSQGHERDEMTRGAHVHLDQQEHSR